MWVVLLDLMLLIGLILSYKGDERTLTAIVVLAAGFELCRSINYPNSLINTLAAIAFGGGQQFQFAIIYFCLWFYRRFYKTDNKFSLGIIQNLCQKYRDDSYSLDAETGRVTGRLLVRKYGTKHEPRGPVLRGTLLVPFETTDYSLIAVGGLLCQLTINLIMTKKGNR
jgi:hypothetical protein